MNRHPRQTRTFLDTGKLSRWTTSRWDVKRGLETSRWYIPWKAFREVVEMVKRADARIGVIWWDDSPAAGVERKVGEAAKEEAASRTNES